MASQVSLDAAALAKSSLVSVQAAIDAIFGNLETELPTLTGDGLTAALAFIEALVPVAVRPIVTAVLSTANAAAHAPAVAAIDAAGLAALALAKARVDSALASLEASV